MARNPVRDLLRSGRLTRKNLTAGQGLVLLALLDHADGDGIAFPSQNLLAYETGLSRMGVRKALIALCAAGSVLEQVEAGGPRRSARYKVLLDRELRATG